jgi:hypothetical protein
LREKRRLTVFENRVLSRIFRPKRDELTELNNLYSLPNILRVIKSRRMRWAGHVERMGRREAYTGSWWEPEGKRPLTRPRRRCEDNIKTDIQEVGFGDMDWIELTLDRDR